MSRHNSARAAMSTASNHSRAELLAAERRTWACPSYRKGARLLVLAYPSSYRVAMSSLGYQVIRRIVEAQPGWRVERLFADTWGRREGPRTFESGLAPASADVLAFSISCETDAPALAALLAQSGLAVLAAERLETDPIVLIGGAAPSLNPEPLAELADLVLIGEGEVALPELLDRLSAKSPKGELLRSAAEVEGVYVPSLYDVAEGPSGLLCPIQPADGEPARVQRACAGALDALPSASDILTPYAEFAGVRLVEIARGCPRRCSFCIVPWTYGRARFRSPESVMRLAGDNGRVGLLGAGAADHPNLLAVIRDLVGAGRQITLSASRADALSEDCLRALVAGGQRTLTLAPESPDDAVRRSIGKSLDRDGVIETARLAARAGFPTIKLYFMLGLPGVADGEEEAIVAFVRELGKAARGARIAVRAGPFVPKPHTPLEREPFADLARLREAMSRLEHGLRLLGRGVDRRLGSPRYSAMEAALSRGDRRLGRALAIMAERRTVAPSAWSAALAEAGIDEEALLRGPGDAPGPLPWQVVGGLPVPSNRAEGSEPDETDR